MGKIEDNLHAFLDGEATEAQESALIHALLSQPKLKEHFVRACRIHYATLSAHSEPQAVAFKKRLDAFCGRWEAIRASSSQCAPCSRVGYGVVGMAAAVAITAGFFLLGGAYERSKGDAATAQPFAQGVASPVRQVRLVQPDKALDGEPLSVTFSVAYVTSKEVDTSHLQPQPELSATFSQAYLQLLRDENSLKQSQSMMSPTSEDVFMVDHAADKFGDSSWQVVSHEDIEPVVFSLDHGRR